MIARQTAVQAAISLKGQRNQIVDIYNSYFDAHPQERPLKYRVKYEDLLCATYVSSIFVKLTQETGRNWLDIVPPNPRARELYQNMEALGCAVQSKTRVPDIGDLIFFGINERIGGINHVGIVTEVKGKQIYYYDIQSVVGRHTCPVGYSYIWGYGMPDYASKDVQPAPAPTPAGFAVGDLVTINHGARWYKGQTIKASCFDDKWYICALKGDRAVLGMNEAETRNIQSPIHTVDITLAQTNTSGPATNPATEKVVVTFAITKESKEILDIIAQGWGLDYGEILDKFLEAAK